MQLSVGFDIDKSGLKKLLAKLSNKEMTKVMQRAVNKTLGNLKAETNRQVRSDRAISRSPNAKDGGNSSPLKFVDIRLKEKKAGSVLGGIQSGSLNISRRGVSLASYSPRRHRYGVTVRVKRDGTRKLIKHAFMAKLKHGNIHVVARVGRKIKALYSTNVADAATNRMNKILAYGNIQLEKNLRAGIARSLKI